MTPDNNIGRFIANTLASIPKMSPAAFDKVFNDRIQVLILSFLKFRLSVISTFVGCVPKIAPVYRIIMH